MDLFKQNIFSRMTFTPNSLGLVKGLRENKPLQAFAVSQKRGSNTTYDISKSPGRNQSRGDYRSGSQEVLDEAKLDHVVPIFLAAVNEDQTWKRLLQDHFESSSNLKKLVNSKNFGTTTCSVMKMVIDYITLGTGILQFDSRRSHETWFARQLKRLL